MKLDRRGLQVGLGLVLLLAGAATVSARMGGGGSYSGGSSSSSSSGGGWSGGGSSGGGGGGGNVQLGPVGTSIAMLVLLGYFGWYFRVPLANTIVWFVGDGGDGALELRTLDLARENPFPRLARLDPGFSRPVFQDLVASLFVLVHQRRGEGRLDECGDYLAERARRALAEPTQGGPPEASPVRDVIVGGVEVREVDGGGDLQRVVLWVRGNLTEERCDEAVSLFVLESWVLVRPQGTPSPRPEPARTLGCPTCAAVIERTPEGRCTHCDQLVPERPMGWWVEDWQRLEVEVLPPPGQDHGGVEAGTRSVTFEAPGLPEARRQLVQRDPDFSWPDFEAFVRKSFLGLQVAWARQDLEALRRQVTPGLFRTSRFWLERYRREGWSNQLDDPEVTRVDLARVDLDAYYEGITVRIFARGLEWTGDREGAVVAGSRDEPRSFSEYWTFLRAVGARSAALDPARCPACGAPRDRIDPQGTCGYCDAVILDGAHGWVLANIEQDEEYRG